MSCYHTVVLSKYQREEANRYHRYNNRDNRYKNGLYMRGDSKIITPFVGEATCILRWVSKVLYRLQRSAPKILDAKTQTPVPRYRITTCLKDCLDNALRNASDLHLASIHCGLKAPIMPKNIP